MSLTEYMILGGLIYFTLFITLYAIGLKRRG